MADITGSQGQQISEVQLKGGIVGGATMLQAVNQNLAGAGITMTLVGVPGKQTFLSGFWVDGLGATAATVVEITTTGLLGGTFRRELSVPAGVALGVTPVFVEFTTPLVASVLGGNIAVIVPSLGAGNVNVVGMAHGYAA